MPKIDKGAHQLRLADIPLNFIKKEYGLKSASQLARELDVSYSSLLTFLRKHRVPIRSVSKSISLSNSNRYGNRHPRYVAIGSTTPALDFYSQIKVAEGKWISKHRYIVAQCLGRDLLTSETVHHINEDKLDNRLNNLMLFSSRSAHQRWHVNIGSVLPSEIIFNGENVCLT